MAIPTELINEIKEAADIVKVISTYQPLTQKGKEYVGICPFHNDTKPSLQVSPEKKIFNCFACNTGGDVFHYVRLRENISFIEAVKKVAQIIGFTDPRLEEKTFVRPEEERKVPFYKCLEDLTTYYQYALTTEEGKPGLDYLLSRRLDEQMQSLYRLGYASEEAKNTITFLQNKGHSLATIEGVGIANVKSGQYTDKNHGRVIFPLMDKNGKVIGYSARTLKPKDDAKYINTQETVLFHKSSVLYNYHIAKEKAHLQGFVYVLEGFMDVFALHKIGIDSAVAIMGTALTDEHIKLLRSLNVEVRLCLDGDKAGQDATMKASKLLEKEHIPFRIVNNQNDSRDPDEILNQEGENTLKIYLNTLVNRVDFALDYFLNTNPLKSNEEKKKLVIQFIPILLRMDNVLEQDTYLRKLSKITGFEIDSIRSLLKESKIATPEKRVEIIKNYQPDQKLLRRLLLAEREMLYQMTYSKEAIIYYDTNVSSFYDDNYRIIASYIVDYASNHENIDINEVFTLIETSDLDNKDNLIDELSRLLYERTHPREKGEKLQEILNGYLKTIIEEKDKIHAEDRLTQSAKGKPLIEQARILDNYNKRRNK